jgi:signal transduction histidine kinase
VIYIKYIAERVKKISNEDLGSAIEIRGNDELAELCKSINSMSIELKSRREMEKEIEIAKDELISNVSHDLRTPLTSIIGYIDLLRRKEYENDEQLEEYITTIYHKAQDLQSLISELFEYTKLTTPGIKLNKVNVELGSLLEQLVGEYVPIINREGLEIKRDIPTKDVYVTADVEKIVRVFDNILVNAKKYSSSPSEIIVSLHCVNNRAIVSISNKTEIIISENLDKLFEKFYRIDQSRKDNDGSGLGLAIAKRIVELHEGKIWTEYMEGMITFNVELEVADYTKI